MMTCTLSQQFTRNFFYSDI